MAKMPEDLDELFGSLRSLLVEFETPRPGIVLEGRSVSDHDFDLWSVKTLVIDGRPRKELYFAGIRRQKAYVGFYYFPIYCLPALAASLAPSLIKRLKGKSCFRVVSLEGGLRDHIRDALRVGLEGYRERGWV
jgi:hypothetical protein